MASSGAQTGHQQAAAGLNRHRNGIIRAIAGVGQQRNQGGETGRIVADPPLGDQCSLVVDQGDVVVGLGPIDPTKHPHDRSSSSIVEI